MKQWSENFRPIVPRESTFRPRCCNVGAESAVWSEVLTSCKQSLSVKSRVCAEQRDTGYSFRLFMYVFT